MRFNNYLEEATIKKSYKGTTTSARTYKDHGYKKPRSADSYLSEAIKLVGTHCRDILNFYRKQAGRYSEYILRGIPGTSAGFRVTDPSAKSRASAYADFNYYTLLINNLPSWATYPKREIICSTDLDKASNYGETYVVFPYDGAKLGICPGSDIFISFDVFGSLRQFNKIINKLVYYVTHKTSTINSWRTLSGFLEKVDIDRFADFVGMGDFGDLDTGDVVDDMYDAWLKVPKKTLFAFINDHLLEPQKNNFRLVTHIPGMNELPEDREIWTDSKCVMVHETNINEFMKEFDDEI